MACRADGASWGHCASRGISTAAVSAVLNPIDVVKTRRQVGIPRTAIQEALVAWREKGAWRGLWRPGLTASLVREMLYSGCTKGLYPLARDLVPPTDAEPGLGHRAAAAALTGLGGSLCANGPDVVKVRLFAEPGRYAGFISAATEISAKEGFVSGLRPTISGPQRSARALHQNVFVASRGKCFSSTWSCNRYWRGDNV